MPRCRTRCRSTCITEAAWIARTLEELRPGSRVRYVRNGIAKDVFVPLERVEPRLDGPLRVLIEGYRGSAFKGMDDAAAAVAAMSEPAHLTAVIPDRADGGRRARRTRSSGRSARQELAELYSEADVVLKLSRIEGMFGPPLEGFHRGATCVVTPVTGHEEFVEHGWNGLVTEWDDPARHGAAARCAGARPALPPLPPHQRACDGRSWPSWEQSSTFMAAALRGIARSPQPEPAASGSLLALDAQAAAAAALRELAARDRALADYEWLKRRRCYRALLWLAAQRHRGAHSGAAGAGARLARALRR